MTQITKCQLAKGTWFRQYYVKGDERGQCRVWCIANINRMNFTETTCPSKRTVGKVTTLFKSAGREDCGNYQHLTMLSIASKITESIICES